MQFDVSSAKSAQPQAAQADADSAILLRQILDVQREHLELSKQVATANDHGARWRALVARWKDEFPDLAETCKEVLPCLERAYGSLIAKVVDELREQGDDGIDTDFTLQDFLDRHGMRLSQLGQILNLVGPLADSVKQAEAQAPGKEK